MLATEGKEKGRETRPRGAALISFMARPVSGGRGGEGVCWAGAICWLVPRVLELHLPGPAPRAELAGLAEPELAAQTWPWQVSHMWAAGAEGSSA